jgi:hypothetical protein
MQSYQKHVETRSGLAEVYILDFLNVLFIIKEVFSLLSKN